MTASLIPDYIIGSGEEASCPFKTTFCERTSVNLHRISLHDRKKARKQVDKENVLLFTLPMKILSPTISQKRNYLSTCVCKLVGVKEMPAKRKSKF